MDKGLNFLKIEDQNILFDADNLFWAASPNNMETGFISRKAISLYEKLKGNLDSQMRDFRFSQELNAVYIDPTDRCNAGCAYCYIPPEIRKNGRALTQKELNFILDKIAAYFDYRKKKAVIVFHASEPLLVKDIIFEAINRYSGTFKFGIQTNAILLKKDDVDFLIDHRVGVGVSLDSYLPFINNRLRPAIDIKGSFAHVLRAIKWFDGYAGLNVITTITRFNVNNLAELVRFLHGKKVPCVLLNPVRFTKAPIRALKPNEDILVRSFIRAVDTAIKLNKNTKHRIVIGNFANIILGIIAPFGRRLMCDISPCGGGRCFFTITAKGQMIPCGEFIGLRGFSGGNIFKTAIDKAMRSGPFRKIRSRITEEIEKCGICGFRNICGAPCPAELHSLGDMYQPSIFCEFYKAIIRHAFKLIAKGEVKYILRKESLDGFEFEYNLNR